MILLRFAMKAIVFLAQLAAILSSAFIAVLTAMDVVMRNFFQQPILGVSEMNQSVLAVLLGFGFVICGFQRDHIRVTLLENAIQRRVPDWAYRGWITGWEVIATSVFAALIWRHAQHLLENYEYSPVLDISIGAVFVVVATLLTLAAVVLVLRLALPAQKDAS
ncbi:MAG: TRAP transporter small permease subunit [Sulfitobacter sp.]